MSDDPIPLTAASIADIAATHYGRPIMGVTDAYGRIVQSEQPPMSPPDRLSAEKTSLYHNKPLLKFIGVRFNGEERHGDVQEYSRKGGWIDVRERNEKGQFKIEDGGYVITRLHGVVEPYWRIVPPAVAAQRAADDAQHDIDAAKDKRARKAAKRASEAGKGAE